MKILSMILLSCLWVYSLFAFARWRHERITEKGVPHDPLQDIFIQIYLKVGAIIILIWVILMAIN